MKSDKFFTKNTIIAITVLVTLIIAVLGGAYYLRVRNRISDEKAQAILESLLPASEEINEIIWGDGLPVAKDAMGKLESVTGAQYRPVDKDCEYKSVKELKKAISKVYSPRFVETDINKIMFDGDGDVLVGRYRDGKNGLEFLFRLQRWLLILLLSYHQNKNPCTTVHIFLYNSFSYLHKNSF